MALPAVQIPEIDQIWQQAKHHANLAREGRPPIENLVLEGGGVKGFAYVGALEVLAENGVLQNVKRVAGSSAGGIVALLLAVGCEPPELMKIMAKELDLKSLLDPRQKTDITRFIKAGPLTVGVSDIWNLFQNKGLYKGDAFVEVSQKIVSNIITKKLIEVIKSQDQAIIHKMQKEGAEPETVKQYLEAQYQQLLEKYYIDDPGNINFDQLEKLRIDFPALKFRELFLTGTRLSNGTLKVFSAEADPKMSIVDALRITMSFPFAFEPVLYQGEYYADGGIASNYPMDIFNQEKFLTHGVNDAKVNPCTLGLLVDTESEIQSRWGIKKQVKDKLKVSSFAKKILEGFHSRMSDLKNSYNINSIQIFDNDLETLNIALSQQNIAELIGSGRTALQQYVDHYVGDDVVYNNLPSYESVYEKYYSKRPEELVRTVEKKLWPSIQELNTFIQLLKKIDVKQEIAEIEEQLLVFSMNEKDKQFGIYLQLEEMAGELDNLQKDTVIVDKKLKAYQIKKRNVIAGIDEATRNKDHNRANVLSRSLVELIKKVSIAEDHKQALEHERLVIKENFQELRKEINNEVYELIEQKQKLHYIADNQIFNKLRKTEIVLQEHMDIALKALSAHKNDYPDPRVNERIESQLYEIKQEYYNEVLKIYREKDRLEESVLLEKAKERSDFFADVVQYGLKTPQAKALTQHFFAMQDIISRNKKHDLLAIQDGSLLREIRSKFFRKLLMDEMDKLKILDCNDEEQYHEVSQFWDNAVNHYLTEDKSISQGYAEYLAKEKTIKHWQAINLRLRQQEYRTYTRESKQQVDIEYALTLQKLTHRLGHGKWGDQIVVTNRQDVKHNLMSTRRVKGEIIGSARTEYFVTSIKTKSAKGRYKATQNTYEMPPIEAHILTPKKENLQNPVKKTKEMIIVFNKPMTNSDREEYALGSTFALRRKKQFSQHKDELIKKILWSLRQMQEEGLQPADAHFKITIAGEGLAGQDAQYLLAAVIDEMNKKSDSVEFNQIHTIDLVLTDPSKVSESLAFKTAASLNALKQRRPDLHVKGYNLIHQKQIGNHKRNKKSSNYLGQANILSKAQPEDATVIADFRDKHDSHLQHQLLTNKQDPELIHKELNESKLYSSNLFIREINFFAKQLKRVGKFLCFQFIPKFTDYVASKISNLSSPLGFLSNPYHRIVNHFKKKNKIHYVVPPWTSEMQSHDVIQAKKLVQSTSLKQPSRSWQEKVKDVVDETSPSKRLKKPSKPPIENIVLGGGGTLSCAYLGALHQLKKDGLLQDLKRVAGSSGGGCIAALYALGYTADELTDILLNTINFKDYLDEPYPVANIFSLFEVQGMKIGVGSLVSLFKNKGLYKGDSFKKLIEKLIEIKLEKNLKQILFAQLSPEEKVLLENVPSFLPEPERNKRIDDYLGDKLSEFKNKYDISQLGRITFLQAERLAKDYPSLNIKELFLTGTKVNDASLKIFSAESEPNMAIADVVRITMSFPGGFIPVKHNDEYYVDGAVAGNYPMHIFDEEKYLSHGANDAMANPCTLGLIVDSQEDIEARWGILPTQTSDLHISTLVFKVFKGIENRIGILREKYNINTVQISDNVSTTNAYQRSDKINLNLTKQDKYQLVRNGQKALKFYHEQYANASIQYFQNEQYDNETQKYADKSVPELERILHDDIAPLMAQINSIQPLITSNHLRLRNEVNQLNIDLASYHELSLLTRLLESEETAQYQLILATKSLANSRRELILLEEALTKNINGRNELLKPFSKENSLIPNDVLERIQLYDQTLKSLQEQIQITTTRFNRFQAHEALQAKEVQVIVETILQQDPVWVEKARSKVSCERELELIEQATYGKSNILQEQYIILRTLENKRGNMTQGRAVPLLLSVRYVKPEAAPQLVVTGELNDVVTHHITSLFPPHEWEHFVDGSVHKFHHKTQVDEIVEVSHYDKAALSISGYPITKLSQVANAFGARNGDVHASTPLEAISFLKALYVSGFDIARIQKVQIQEITLPNLQQIVHDIQNPVPPSLKNRSSPPK